MVLTLSQDKLIRQQQQTWGYTLYSNLGCTIANLGYKWNRLLMKALLFTLCTEQRDTMIEVYHEWCGHVCFHAPQIYHRRYLQIYVLCHRALLYLYMKQLGLDLTGINEMCTLHHVTDNHRFCNGNVSHGLIHCIVVNISNGQSGTTNLIYKPCQFTWNRSRIRLLMIDHRLATGVDLLP